MLYRDSETISHALSKYYELNGLPADGGGQDKWARYKIGPFLLIGYPNFQHRMQAIARHDIHHIINNFDTSSLGEGLIAAWELGSGCNKYWISWCMEPQAFWWGILLAPRQAYKNFVLGRNSKNLFAEKNIESCLAKTVGEIRSELLPRGDVSANIVDLLLFILSGLLGIVMILIFIPIFSFFTLLGLVLAL